MLFTCLWFVCRPRPRNKTKRYETNMKYAWEIRASKIKICHRPWMKLNLFWVHLSNEWALARTPPPAHTGTHTQLYAYFVHVSSCRKVHWLAKEKCLSFSRHKVKVPSHISLYILSSMTKSRIKCRRRDSVNTHTYAWAYCTYMCGMNLHVISCQYRRALNAIN